MKRADNKTIWVRGERPDVQSACRTSRAESFPVG
jgi:hypothetical protein